VDPMEGSAIILPGSGLFALGAFLGHHERRLIVYRVWVFALITFGVGAMWGLSAIGGIGGTSGHSMWWGMLIVPYLIGWFMGLWGPGSPRWLLLLAIVVGLWYLAMVAMLLKHANAHRAGGPVVILGALGVLAILGSISRLWRSRPKAAVADKPGGC